MSTLISSPAPQTVQEALELCDELDRQAKEVGMPNCVRARRAHESLDRPDSMWGESPARLEMFFRGLGQIVCGCHKYGTYNVMPKIRRRRR